MVMTPRLRKFALTAHVTTSVGWLGAVAASLALAVAALSSEDTQVVRGISIAMEMIGWYALVPFSLASLASGLLQSLGTRWGLLRHYWVLVKLIMNVLAIAVLLLYMQTLGYAAEIAAKTTMTGADLDVLMSPSPAVHGSAAVLLLLVAVTLSVYKPPGITRYGLRKQEQHGMFVP
jgi:hypothetical protein